MSDELEKLKAAVRAAVREILAEERGIPMVMTYQRAARELDCSVTKIKGLVTDGHLLPVTIGKRKMIPRTELLRISQPDGPRPPSRRSGRPKAIRYDPTVESEKLAAMRAKRGR